MKVFGWSSALVPIAFCAAAWGGGETAAIIVFLLFHCLCNLPHQYGTWRRIAIEQRLTRRWLVMAAMTVAILAAAACTPPTLRSIVFGDIFVYWGLYHLGQQNFGLCRIVGRQQAEAVGNPRSDRLFHLAIMALTATWVQATTAMHYTLLGEQIRLYRLPLSDIQSTLLAGLSAGIAGVLVAWRFWSHHQHRRSSLIRFEGGIVLGIVASLAAPTLLVTIAGLTAVHNIQYISLVHAQQTQRFLRPRPYELGFIVLYVVVVVGCAWWNAALGATVFAILVSWHYLADAQLWHPTRDQRLATDLRIIPTVNPGVV